MGLWLVGFWSLPALAFGAATWSRYQRMQDCRDAMEECGLRVEQGSWFGGLRVKARTNAMDEIRIEGSQGRKSNITVMLPRGKGFHLVTIRRELYKPSSASSTGDESFDRKFSLDGSSLLLAARLNGKMRRLLTKASADNRFVIGDGSLVAEMPADQLRHRLPLLLEIEQSFAENEDIAQCLAENAQYDLEPGVRLRNLLLLVQEFPGAPETLAALRAACSDGRFPIRLEAAKKLGAEGRPVLLELAESPVDDATSAAAVSTLNQDLPVERTRAILAQALRQRRVQTAGACLKLLGDRISAEDVDTLAAVLAREKGALAVAAATALGTTGSTDAEPPLVLALRRNDKDLRLAAADSLRRIGTGAAVMPLKKTVDDSLPYSELRRVARQAIAEIQSRLPGASPGQLSLTSTEEGRLSLAQTEAGQLSLANDPAGELSLSGGEEG